jgi:hypothetical protein
VQDPSLHRGRFKKFIERKFGKRVFSPIERIKMSAVIDQIAYSLEKHDIDHAFNAILSNDLILEYIMFENPDPKILEFFPGMIEAAVRNQHSNSEWFLKVLTSGLASILDDGWYYGLNRICSFDSLQKQVLEGSNKAYDEASHKRLEIVLAFIERSFYQLPLETKEWMLRYFEARGQEARSINLMKGGPWLDSASDAWKRERLLSLLPLSNHRGGLDRRKTITSVELVLLEQLLGESGILTGKRSIELVLESYIQESNKEIKEQLESLLLKIHDKSNLLPIKSLARLFAKVDDQASAMDRVY